MHRLALAFALLPAPLALAVEEAPAPRPAVDLTGYRSPKDALPADPKVFRQTAAPAPVVAGYVGVEVGSDEQGRAVVLDVAPDSPAEKAGLKPGDVVRTVAGVEVPTAGRLKDQLRGTEAGKAVAFGVVRDGSETQVKVTPRPASQPLVPGEAAAPTRAVLGIQMEAAKGGGAAITSVTPGGGADKAGVKVGDVVLRIDDAKVEADSGLREVLSGKKPGEVVTLALKRGEQDLEIRATLGGESRGGLGRGSGWDDRIPRNWAKPTYKLAVIGIEFADVKHSDKIAAKDWEESLFSLGTYSAKSATGQVVYGSMNDYYKEISYGTFTVGGKFLGWAELPKKRAEYGQGTSKTPLLNDAMEKATAKFGQDALADYDGLFILYAGSSAATNRGNVFWPHRASLTHQGKRWPYFIVNEVGRGGAMQDISVFCHEFGHMLGLPDLYAQPERPGMEGVGRWCAMSQQAGGGRPQHFSAWCKEQLGWAKPTVIDPRVKQKLILGPIADDPTQCFKVPVRPDGSEYFLLENRRKKGFDASVPGEGLLIWRVAGRRVLLEESHGIEGARGPGEFPTSVPFPSTSNSAFTPYTTPSSKGQLGGGLDVYITNIRKLPDGRITFHIGYEYQ